MSNFQEIHTFPVPCSRFPYNESYANSGSRGGYAYDSHRYCRKNRFWKTTLTRHLNEHFSDAATSIGHDSHYKRQDGKPSEGLTRINYDHSSNFDMELLIRHLKTLKAGKSILSPIYSYIEHNCTNKMVDVHPSRGITAEEIIFQNPALKEMFDIKILWKSMSTCVFCAAACRMLRSESALTVRGHMIPYNGHPHA